MNWLRAIVGDGFSITPNRQSVRSATNGVLGRPGARALNDQPTRRGVLVRTTDDLTVAQQKFASEHGTPAQRFFNVLCVAYGADPKLFSDVVEKGFLPDDRAIGCKREYLQLSHAFATLIGPHIDRSLARKLHKRWLPSITTQPKTWPESH